MSNYSTFLAITFLAALTPGPAVFLAIRNGATYGIKMASIGILGNISAVFIFAMISATGLGLLLLSSSGTLFWLNIAGGAYLIYLGLRPYCSNSNVTRTEEKESGTLILSRRKLYSEAFMVGVSNPKAILFFTALFPQFIDPKASSFYSLVTLAIGCSFCSCVCLLMYATASSKFTNLIRKSRIEFWFNRLVGGVFLTFGIFLITSVMFPTYSL